MDKPCRPRGAVALLCALIPALPLPCGAPQASRRLQELEQRFAEERRTWLEFRKQARSAEELAELAAAFPRDELVEELGGIAREARGTDVAARAWLDVLRIASLLDDRALHGQALERLLAEHVASPEMAGLALELVYGAPSWSAPAAADAMRRILAGNPDRNVQAGVLAELALLVGLDESFGAAGRAEAETLLARIEAEFGAAPFLGMDGNRFAAGARHEIAALRVGQPAPDFEGTDQHGARFELSDYRGQVVLLDFWGFV